MTLVSCNLFCVTLKVVWAEIPAVCFCVKYQTARAPSGQGGLDEAAAGHFLTPPLEKTNSLTMKHLSPPPPHYIFLLLPSTFSSSHSHPHLFLFTVLSSGRFLFSYISPFSLICVSLCVFVDHVAPFRWQKKQHNIRPIAPLISPQCILLLLFSSGESRLQVITPP